MRTRRSVSHSDTRLAGRHSSQLLLVFCGVLFIILLAIVTGIVKTALPGAVSSKISYNSEGYLYSLVMIPWIFYVARPQRGRLWSVLAVGLGAAWVALGLWLLNSSMPNAVKTLNEPALALGFLVPYVALRRPLSRGIAAGFVVGVLTVIALGIRAARPEDQMKMESSNWVVSLGETVMLVLLTVIALDLVERWILLPSAKKRASAHRTLFYSVLVLTPVVVSMLGRTARVGNEIHSMVLNYLGRVHEAFVGVLLLCVFFLLAEWLDARRQPEDVEAVAGEFRVAGDELARLRR